MKQATIFIAIVCLCLPAAARAASFDLTATVKLPSVCGNHIREDGEQCDGPDMGSAGSCAGIGFDGGPLTCSSSCTFDVSMCAAPQQTVFTTSFPVAGGTYAFNATNTEQVVLTVPPNSATSTLTLITFVRPSTVDASSTPAPDTMNYTRSVYDLYFVTSDGDVVHTLSSPVTVVLPYGPGDLVGMDEGSLAVFRREDGETRWHRVTGGILNTAARTVSFTTDTFSSFTIFARRIQPASPPLPRASPGLTTSESSDGSFVNTFKQVLAAIVSPFTTNAPSLPSERPSAPLDTNPAPATAKISPNPQENVQGSLINNEVESSTSSSPQISHNSFSFAAYLLGALAVILIAFALAGNLFIKGGRNR